MLQVGTVLAPMPPEGLYPAIGMHSEGEEVRINVDARWEHSDVTLMSIDNCEEEWARLHDVRINGQVRTGVNQTYPRHRHIVSGLLTSF